MCIYCNGNGTIHVQDKKMGITMVYKCTECNAKKVDLYEIAKKWGIKL